VISVAATFGGQRGAFATLELRHENAEGPMLIAVKTRKQPEHLNGYKLSPRAVRAVCHQLSQLPKRCISLASVPMESMPSAISSRVVATATT
jgi:hypothetical protein